MSREKIAAVLSNYIPHETVDECTSWIIQKNIHLKITRGRASKFGDYKPLERGKGHHISVNHDLNKYAFLITFVHEVAHLHTYTKYPFRHEPHGREWKNEFRNLLGNFVVRRVFPDDISTALSSYLKNPAATSCSDHHLFRTLKKVRKFFIWKNYQQIPDSHFINLVREWSFKKVKKCGPDFDVWKWIRTDNIM